MIDAHAHLSDPRLEIHAEHLVSRLQTQGLKHVVLGGVEPSEWQCQRRLKARWPSFLTSVVGIHPWTIRDRDDASLEKMFEVLNAEIFNAQALGEVGLDFYPKRLPEQVERQSRWCLRQLHLAKSIGKPVVLHVVRGHDVMQKLLKSVDLSKAMIHGFKGKEDVARFYLERGYILSLGSRSFHGCQLEDYRWLPKDGFVLESDAPPWKEAFTDVDKISEDWVRSLHDSAAFLADLWSMSKEEVWSLTETNLNKWCHPK